MMTEARGRLLLGLFDIRIDKNDRRIREVRLLLVTLMLETEDKQSLHGILKSIIVIAFNHPLKGI